MTVRRPLTTRLGTARARFTSGRAGILMGEAWDRFASNGRLAWVNLLFLIRSSPPQMVQFLASLWPIAWGINALLVGASLWATAPALYLWMHTGPFAWASPGAWGLAQLFLGMHSVRALVWPTERHAANMVSAARALCGLNAGLALGYGLACPANPGWLLYALLTGACAWCLYRLAAHD